MVKEFGINKMVDHDMRKGIRGSVFHALSFQDESEATRIENRTLQAVEALFTCLQPADFVFLGVELLAQSAYLRLRFSKLLRQRRHAAKHRQTGKKSHRHILSLPIPYASLMM